MENYLLRIYVIVLSVLPCILLSCSDPISEYTEVNRKAQIDPDYSDITIPPNIAPLNFMINEKADKYHVKLYSLDGNSLSVTSSNNNIKFSPGKWKALLEVCKGQDIFMEIYIKQKGNWIKFKANVNHITIDSINSYLVYRLIYPGFKGWEKMGIYQRNLENFDEIPIMTNNLSHDNCMNCHNFCMNNSQKMLFHLRGKIAGTLIYNDGEIKWVNTRTDQTISPGVYPAWHPNGKYVVFSVNQIIQKFHAVPEKKIEVLDTVSDLIFYDIEKNIVSNCSSIASKDRLETFPSWSPDGQSLFFCSAKALPLNNDNHVSNNYNHIKYDLLRVAFNPVNQQFGPVDTILSSSRTGLSISFPRISPDGKYLLFNMSSYGNFTIWHSDSDLYIMNLDTYEIIKPDINSSFSDSYHTWSSTGRWIVFSSRRDNELFTRPYFAYFDTTGKAYKPFLLPQKNPKFYKTFLKSFNIPELITTPVNLNGRDLYKTIRTNPENASFSN